MYNDSLENVQNGTNPSVPIRSNVDVYDHFGKRLVDIFISILAAPVTILVIAFAAIFMFVTGDRGQILFGHRRVGKNGRVFKCWKIRTMVVDAEAKLFEHLQNDPDAAAEWELDRKLDNDPRITKFGAFLRRTSLDELPQFWNVLCGDMSVVGPRPIVRSELHKYGEHRKSYLSLKPGVTGLWQVSGRNDVSYIERVNLDVKYLSSVSFLGDVAIIAKTFQAILTRTGK